MGRPTTESGASRAAHNALLNLPNQANAKSKQHHHSVVVRKRIEYSSRYASCLKSWHLIDHQQCHQRAQPNSNYLANLLFGLKPASGPRVKRFAKMRVRSLKPISALNADTFLTCTFLLILTCAIVSLLLSFEAAGAAAAGLQHHNQHHHNHKHNNDILTHDFNHHVQHHLHHEPETQANFDLGPPSRAEPDQERLPPPLERKPNRRPPPERDPPQPPPVERLSKNVQLLQKHKLGHPNTLKPMREPSTRSDSDQQPRMRFRGFATASQPTSFNLSAPHLRLHSDNEFDSYNVDDVFKDDDDDDVEDESELEADPEDLDGPLEDGQEEEEEEEREEEEEEEDEADNEIDLDALDQGVHSRLRHVKAGSTLKPADSTQRYQHHAHRKLQRHSNGIGRVPSKQRVEETRKAARADRRHHELPKPRVPYQTPIVVSISDNSFVSASPVVLTTRRSASGGGGDDQQAAGSSGSSAGEDSDDDEAAAAREPLQLTTSTTATTTRGAFEESSSRSRAELELELEDKVVGPQAPDTRTNPNARIVLDEMKRYNYIVSDLERPRRPASERPHGKRSKSSAELEMQLPRTRSESMQTREPDVDLAPTVGTLSVVVEEANQDDGNLDADEDAANEIDLLDDKDGDDDDDEEERANERSDEQDEVGQEVEMDARFARASHQLDELIRQSALEADQSTGGKYAHLIVNPRNELPSHARRHLASIRMSQADPNEFQQTGALNGAIIAILSGIGVTGVLVLIVGVKMRSIRERIAHKGRRRSLVPDTDFLINTIPI